MQKEIHSKQEKKDANKVNIMIKFVKLCKMFVIDPTSYFTVSLARPPHAEEHAHS